MTVLLDALVDNFDGNNLDQAKWPRVVGTITAQNQRAEFTKSASSLISHSTYTLPGSTLFCRAHPPVGVATSQIVLDVTCKMDAIRVVADRGSNKLWWRYVKSAFTNVWTDQLGAYDPVNHAWIKLREAAGTLYLEGSADGLGWNTLITRATPAGVSVADQAGFTATSWFSGTPTTPGFIDNVNVAP